MKIAVDGKIPYVNVGFAGLPGVYTGLNERGIAGSVNTAAFTKQVEHNVIPVGFLLAEILENGASFRDVDSVMQRASASHYFIAVSSRDERAAAVYESLGGTITKVPMTSDVLFVANAPLSPTNRRDNASILSPLSTTLPKRPADHDARSACAVPLLPVAGDRRIQCACPSGTRHTGGYAKDIGR